MNELNTENMGEWPWLAKLVVMVMLSFGVTVIGYIFAIKGPQEQFYFDKRHETQLKNTFKEKHHLVSSLSAYKAQMLAIQDSFSALLRQLPESTEVPGLVEDISHVASANGLSIRFIQLQPEHKQDFYTELPINMLLTGNYHQLARFVSDVSALPRIVTLHDFSIEVELEQESNKTLLMHLTAKTYRYRAEEADCA